MLIVSAAPAFLLSKLREPRNGPSGRWGEKGNSMSLCSLATSLRFQPGIVSELIQLPQNWERRACKSASSWEIDCSLGCPLPGDTRAWKRFYQHSYQPPNWREHGKLCGAPTKRRVFASSSLSFFIPQSKTQPPLSWKVPRPPLRDLHGHWIKWSLLFLSGLEIP